MNENRRGVLFGVAAYGLWGLFPLYFHELAPAGAGEVLIHRCLWSLLCVALVLSALRHWSWVRPLLADRRRLGLISLAAVAIAVNWGVYIWSVNLHHVVEAALGYYINPLITVVLGVVVLHERLPLTGWIAVGFAVCAVAVLTVSYGRPPYLALVLAVSFAAYGFLKKKVNTPALEGLTVETGVLAVPALIACLVLTFTGNATFGQGAGHTGLLIGSGFVTAVPLLLFGAAATRVPLTTMGILQYLTPTGQFLVAVLIQHEPLPTERLVGCILIWIALAVFTVGNLHQRRSDRRPPGAESAGDLGDALVGSR